LVTTLVDPLAYPAEAIAALYLERWSVALHFRRIKITLALDVLRCLTPAMIETSPHYCLEPHPLAHATRRHPPLREFPRLSFKGTLDTLPQFANAVHASEGKPRKQAALLDSMLEIVAAFQTHCLLLQ
jgi:hypothetical protein